ncbi:MAG: lipid A deacylase LpxR family protein [Rhodocyclales bacterium]|nr:lipid A deacylase LpxR family protein [Rhodocyclales bacterium]
MIISPFDTASSSLPLMIRFIVLLTLLAVFAPLGRAQLRPPEGSEFQLFVENDLLARTDRYYTNGIKLGGGAPFGMLQLPATELLKQLAPEGGNAIHLGLFLGQNLYTPKSIKVSQPQPLDRPWAAWLYLGGVAQRAKENRLDTVEIDLGLVGPSALGRDVQAGWHRLIGAPQPMGWQNQIPNEPAFLVSYLSKSKHVLGRGASVDLELIPHGGATLGTVMTLARGGGILRLGQHMTGFGPDTIEPGGAMLQNMRRDIEPGRSHGMEWYAFAGLDHRLITHNIFLDGTVFRDSPGVRRRAHVYDISAGLSLRIDNARISLTRVRRSEEFFTAASSGGGQTFDSINLGIEF